MANFWGSVALGMKCFIVLHLLAPKKWTTFCKWRGNVLGHESKYHDSKFHYTKKQNKTPKWSEPINIFCSSDFKTCLGFKERKKIAGRWFQFNPELESRAQESSYDHHRQAAHSLTFVPVRTCFRVSSQFNPLLHSWLWLQSQGARHPLLASMGVRHSHGVQTHVQTKHS